LKLKHSLLMGTAFALLALVTLLGSGGTVHAQTFNPTLETEVANPVPGANSDFTTNLSISKGDSQFGLLVNFIPPEWGVTRGEDIPIGAVVGQLTAQATLGIIGAQCDNVLTVQFTMLNASIDITDTVSFDDTDEEGAEGSDTGDVFEDKDGSGLQDGIEKYPEFINRIVDNAQPIGRAAGIQIVAGADVLLQFLIFEPGSVIIRELPSEESRGYPTVTFLQAIGDPESNPEPNPITDFCSPLESTINSFGVSKDNGCTDDEPIPPMDRGLCEVTSSTLDIIEEAGTTEPDESGHVLFTNPPAGTYEFTAAAWSQRDADGDGIENALDTCPYTVNQGDPRIKGDGDFDIPAPDGLDAACDPDDTVVNSDQDADGYLNRGDNCPLIANGEEETNQKDSDVNEFGDARPDGIGDVCDENPTVPDGDNVVVEFSSNVTIGEDVPPPDETPDDGDGNGPTTVSDDDDDGGSAVIFIIIGVVAAVVVLGGGGFLLMRRGGA
jgi:hypothetical protein